jgi:hypothetical protein
LITLDDLTLDEASSTAPSQAPSTELSQFVRWGLALLSLGAAGIHFAVTGMHFGESWYHGTFFAMLAWLQLLWAVAVLVKPSRRLLLAGIIGNIVAIEVWLVSRTIGIPFGSNAGDAESVGFVDVLATVFEAGIALGAFLLLRQALASRPVRSSLGAAAVGVIGAAVIALSTYSLTPTFASSHHDGGGGEQATGANAATGGHGHPGASGAGEPGGSHVGATNVSITADGSSLCEKSGTAVEGNSGHGHRGPVPFEPLSPADREVFIQQVAQSNHVIATYPTVKEAEAAGWRRVTPYVPCIAAHYLKGSALTNPFDPSEPEILLYDGTEDNSRIVGLSYLQFTSPGNPPEGFAGPNDPWHVHEYLCIGRRGVLGDTSVSEEECRARGGTRQKLNNLWMTHMWNAPGWDSRWGLFSSEHPDLGGRIGDINGTPNPEDSGLINGTRSTKS